MKKILTAFAAALLLMGCAKEYDDSGLKARIDALETRVNDLETSIQSIQSAVGDGVFVAKVQEYTDPDSGRVTGVTITYTNGDVKWFQIVPTNPAEGPVFSVIRNGAGELVWAVDGVSIKIDGKEVPVYQTPEFSIDDEGMLWVEIDGKKTQLGQVQNEGATLQDGIFTDIKVLEDKVVLTLSDGSTVNIPFAEAFELKIDKTEYLFTEVAPIEIPYTVTAKTAKTVVGASYDPKAFNVEIGEEKIVVTPYTDKSSGMILLYADSKVGLTSIVNVVVEAEGVEVLDEPAFQDGLLSIDYIAEAEAATVEAHVLSNVDFDVVPEDEWISVASVKSKVYTITLKLQDNPTEEGRIGTVNIVRKGTEDVLQTITIGQLPKEPEPVGPADLSKKQSANTYIVTAPGEYMFKAVKGNSEESVGTVAKVEVLWETEGTETAPAEGSIIAEVAIEDGVIYFSTPDELVPGGAVIVAKDAADAILWNWFIWIPKTPINIITNEAFYSLPVMDRNLGALDAATPTNVGRETYGMYYQWGRNNPLPGFAKATAEITKEAGPKSTAYAIANPTVFINVGESDSAGNWNEEDLAYLWQTESGEKAIFDPCPPGYKVPAYDASTGLWVNSNDGWTFDFDAKYFAYGDIVFPVAGWYSSSASVGYEGERSILHSATAYSNPRDRNKIIRKDKSGYYYANYFKQEAASVRCVVVDESAIVPPVPNPGEDPGDEPGETIADLSSEASANCYVIGDPGVYKFKAVKGNSAESVGAVAGAKVVWETVNTATAPEMGTLIAGVEAAAGYIFFETPETLVPGNALIAAIDESDNILWSWHIWIPATEIATITDATFFSAPVMDRNLGAINAATVASPTLDTYGLYYQWGRKDPFTGKAKAEGTAFDKVTGPVSTAYTLQNPTIYVNVGESDSAGNWNEEDLPYLWETEEGKKAIYDPCPAGYKVPAFNASVALWADNNNEWTYNWDGLYCASGDLVFPVCGWLSGGPSLSYEGERIIFHSATAYSNPRDRNKIIRKDKSGYYYSNYFKVEGATVRCVAEVTE